MPDIIYKIFRSLTETQNSFHSVHNLLNWIENLNDTIRVKIEKICMNDDDFWYYSRESGYILNRNKSFFSITGMKSEPNIEQPVIIQNEIGFLGIICKEISGVLHFLMQAKIEPGNVNKIQISPTIQATKSNFTQKHGGARPAYLDYFINAKSHEIIVDQIQSEQSSRFFKKRNRNIIIHVTEDIEVLPNHNWMTLWQIKQLMKYNNLVNMDTRTVLSCIPYVFTKENTEDIKPLFSSQSFFNSIFNGDPGKQLPEIYHYINNYKMFNESKTALVPLHTLKTWRFSHNEYICDHPYPFKIVFCDISIEGREVRHWTQPLFEANQISTFALITCAMDHVKKFLVKAVPEPGCFDKIELGPTFQESSYYSEDMMNEDVITRFLKMKLKKEENILYDVVLSEEGGRFFHEQNRNIIIEVHPDEIPALPDGYFLVDYKTLNILTQINNCMNIQLRNLLSLLEV